jgi:hypothetical protein
MHNHNSLDKPLSFGKRRHSDAYTITLFRNFGFFFQLINQRYAWGLDAGRRSLLGSRALHFEEAIFLPSDDTYIVPTTTNI